MLTHFQPIEDLMFDLHDVYELMIVTSQQSLYK